MPKAYSRDAQRLLSGGDLLTRVFEQVPRTRISKAVVPCIHHGGDSPHPASIPTVGRLSGVNHTAVISRAWANTPKYGTPSYPIWHKQQLTTSFHGETGHGKHIDGALNLNFTEKTVNIRRLSMGTAGTKPYHTTESLELSSDAQDETVTKQPHVTPTNANGCRISVPHVPGAPHLP